MTALNTFLSPRLSHLDVLWAVHHSTQLTSMIPLAFYSKDGAIIPQLSQKLA